MAQISYDNTRALLDKWTPLTAGVEETQPTAPVTIMTGEALDLSHFIDNHWEPVAGNPGRPGLKSAVAGGLIAENTAVELRELVVVVSRIHAEFRAVNAKTLEAPVDRGMFLLYELKHCLEFLFDDGEDNEHDAELDRLSESHTDTSSHDGLALSLEGFAYHANKFRDELAALPEFDQPLPPSGGGAGSHGVRQAAGPDERGPARSKERLAFDFAWMSRGRSRTRKLVPSRSNDTVCSSSSW